MALIREPTRFERQQMMKHHLAFPCLWAAMGMMVDPLSGAPLHTLCAGVYVHDRSASPDDWQRCTCACHALQHAERGNVIMRMKN
jgi:hypothetical protein